MSGAQTLLVLTDPIRVEVGPAVSERIRITASEIQSPCGEQVNR